MKKKIIFSFFLCLFIFLNIFSFCQNGWEILNPSIPNCNFHSVHFPCKDTGYAVGDCGTIVMTTDAGAIWHTLCTSINKNDELFTVHFINNLFGTVCSKNCAYKTDNGGQNWERLSLGCSSIFNGGTRYYGIWPINENKYYAVGVGYRDYPPDYWGVPFPLLTNTYNGGNTFFCEDYDFNDDHFQSIYFTLGNIGYIGTINGNIKRNDNFSGWTFFIGPTGDNIMSFSFPSEEIGFAIGTSGLILKSTDKGINWTQINSGNSNHFISVSFPSISTGYIAGYSGTILQTSDTGSTWNQINSNTVENLSGVCFTDDSTGYFVGSHGTLLQTKNGGDSLYPYLNSENSITLKNLYALSLPSKDAIYVVGEDGIILKSQDVGANWSTDYIPDSSDIYSSFFINDNTGYISGASGMIYKTVDGGNIWMDVSDSNNTDTLFSIFFTDGTTGFAVGSNGRLIMTNDGGNSWTAINSGTANDLNSVCFASADTGYAVGDHGTVLKTVDGGFNWELIPISSAQYINFTSIRLLNSHYGYIIGNLGTYGKLLKIDHSFVWMYTPSYYYNELYGIFIQDMSNIYTVGGMGTIIKTADGFSSCIPNYGSCSDLNAISFINPDTGFVVGDGGVILRTTMGSVLDVPEFISDKNNFDVLVYPNPAENNISFSFELADKSAVVLNVYDILGHLISKNEFEDLPVGFNEINLNCSSFASGLYYYQLIADKSSASGKFIKQ